MSSPDNEERYNSLFKIGSTSAACLIAGVITYPAESYRIGWEQSTLSSGILSSSMSWSTENSFVLWLH